MRLPQGVGFGIGVAVNVEREGDALFMTRNRRDFERIEGLRLEVWPPA